MSWVRDAYNRALLEVDNGTLVRAAGQHVQPEGEWTPGRLRPSLLADECRLARVKKFLAHGPQPGVDHGYSRQGEPSATANLFFVRGFLGEGLVVAALKAVADDYAVVGCAPELVFEAETELGLWQAHPDLVVMRGGEMELVQIKCPSVFAFERHTRGKSIEGIKQRYALQVAVEMYVGRLMGWPIARGHVFLVTWEGNLPGSGLPDEPRTISTEVEWHDDLGILVEERARELVLDVEEARVQGIWPRAYPKDGYNRFPCSYCPYPRVPMRPGHVTCEESEAWT